MKVNAMKIHAILYTGALIIIWVIIRPLFENYVDYVLFGIAAGVILGSHWAILLLCVQILRKLEGNISSQNKSVDESITEARPSVTEDNTC